MAERTEVVNLFQESYQVYMGRPDDDSDPSLLEIGAPGFLGNPFKTGSPEDNLADFRRYFLERVKNDTLFRRAVLSCYGLRLGCFCNSGASSCHARLVASWINSHRLEWQEQMAPLPLPLPLPLSKSASKSA